MLLKTFLLSILLLPFIRAVAQQYITYTFDDTTLTNDNAYLNDIANAPGGGVVSCGYSDTSGMVISLDSSGTPNWGKRYDASEHVIF